MKFPLHINIMLVYVNCGHFRWKLSLASQPPWFLSPPPLSPARTSSPQCSPAPCRSSCTWTVDIWENFFGNHFYIVDPTTSQFDRERLRQKSLTPYLGYFPKERGLFVCFGFPIKSRTDCRFPYLVTLSPQNSVITVCPVTPSTFVHIIVNFCTYQLQHFYISIKTIVSYLNHCTMWVYRPDFTSICIAYWTDQIITHSQSFLNYSSSVF